jgi:D-threo-aldose 1-dehydrogenase
VGSSTAASSPIRTAPISPTSTGAAPRFVERAQRIEAACDRFGVALPAAALQFPLAHPAVVAVLTGARSPEEICVNAASASAPIPGGLWAALSAEGLLDPAAPVPGVG